MQNKDKYKHPTNTFEISRLHFSVTTLHGLVLVLSQRPLSLDVVCYYESFTLLSSYDQRSLGVGGEKLKDHKQGVLNYSLIPYLSTDLSFNRN